MARAIEEILYDIEEALVQPGTYFNPQTEVVVVVDDSVSLDQEVFNMEPYEGADWVRISDDLPIDEARRDQLLEEFQSHYHPDVVLDGAREDADEELDLDEDEELSPDGGEEPAREG
jgi:hypothetical protein